MSSWSSKALPWLIPSLFLTAPAGSLVVMVSPWAEDVPLRIYRWEGRWGRLEGEQPLTEVLRWLARERGLRFRLVARDGGDPRVRSLCSRAGPILEVQEVPNLHAKMILTDRLVLRTSANLLTRSLYENVETLALEPNPDGDALKRLQRELGRFGIRA